MADRRSMYIEVGVTGIDLKCRMKLNPVWQPDRMGDLAALEITPEELEEDLLAEVTQQAQQVVPDLIRTLMTKAKRRLEQQAKQPINQEASG